MSALFNGADCGPVNPLKSFTTRLEQERGSQLDRNVSGPSRQTPFRALPNTQSFIPGPKQGQAQPQPFNLSSLERALTPQAPAWAVNFNGLEYTPQAHQSAWANSSLSQVGPAQIQSRTAARRAMHNEKARVDAGWATDFQTYQPAMALHAGPHSTQMPMPMHHPMEQQMHYHPQPMHQPGLQQPPMVSQPHLMNHDQSWGLNSSQKEEISASQFPPEIQANPPTELSEAASHLLSTLALNAQASSNPKLANSQFIQLMQEFASGQKTVEGDEVTTGEKGKGKATGSWTDEFEKSLQSSLTGQRSQMFEMDPSIAHAAPSGVPSTLEEALGMKATAVPGTMANWEDTTFPDDLEAFMHYNGGHTTDNSQQPKPEWDQLQDAWDTFEHGVGAVGGVRQVDVEKYLFQRKNPHYAEAERLAEMGAFAQETYRGLLECEAAVQANPRDVSAWYDLGIKQQENERDGEAILALSKVVQLDPTHRQGHLALAVSYTNESQNEAAQISLAEWARLVDERYQIDPAAEGFKQRHASLIEIFLDIARTAPEGEVDADVQVALGVLFSTSQDYVKSIDCFLTALTVRPEDFMLYNRVAATYANNGEHEKAMELYDRALSFNPSFVRALYNMGISLIHLEQYTAAAQRCLDALRLQQADATEAYSASDEARPKGPKGVTSAALWLKLREACMKLNRHDLMVKCTDHDLAAFNNEFIE